MEHINILAHLLKGMKCILLVGIILNIKTENIQLEILVVTNGQDGIITGF